MKCSLLSMIMVVAAAPAFALPTNPIMLAVNEPSTVSLITAGIVALGFARRKADKAPK